MKTNPALSNMNKIIKRNVQSQKVN